MRASHLRRGILLVDYGGKLGGGGAYPSIASPPSPPVVIGGVLGGARFNGLVDDVRWYHRADGTTWPDQYLFGMQYEFGFPYR